ncbi:AbiJ-NTD4 domain-containing protein [Terrimonas alba]|uniref:AbiJ-NTD4 domain-containing protein n=1 Tax=Terrimonas alba TaxID=3349636 RepID=UPI0035F4CD3B
MNKFSDRIRVTSPKSIIQKESIDKDLLNALWNALYHFYWDLFVYERFRSCPQEVRTFWLALWLDYFKERVDELDQDTRTFIAKIKQHFFNTKWYEVYNFLEFVCENYQSDYSNTNKEFQDYCNSIFEKELSAYRFINGVLTPITTEEEIKAIELSLNIEDKYSSIKSHLAKGLKYLSDRQNPDYKNSIKESVCAVEAMCCVITGRPKATLGESLKLLEKDYSLHSALKKSLDGLYGYASDAQGVRHGGGSNGVSNPTQDEAMLVLITCSAIINYLIKKNHSSN